MMFGIAENRVPERRATAVVCQIVGKNGSFTQLLAFFAFFCGKAFKPAGILLKLR
jgi:hypothetical protein